jgi:phosphoglycolate phosphatase
MQINLLRYKHVIWDWNGTLLDDAWVCVEVLNEILKKYNKPLITLEQYRRDFDFPVKDYYRYKLGFDFSIEPFEIIANEYIELYNKRRFECRLHDKAVEVLKYLAGNNIEQSILSAYEHKMLEETVSYFGIRQYFTRLAGLNDYYAQSKVENAKLLMGKLDFDSEQVVLIGDTVHDFEVAQSVDIDCVLIANGHNSPEKLISCGTRVLSSLEEIQLTVVPK